MIFDIKQLIEYIYYRDKEKSIQGIKELENIWLSNNKDKKVLIQDYLDYQFSKNMFSSAFIYTCVVDYHELLPYFFNSEYVISEGHRLLFSGFSFAAGNQSHKAIRAFRENTNFNPFCNKKVPEQFFRTFFGIKSINSLYSMQELILFNNGKLNFQRFLNDQRNHKKNYNLIFKEIEKEYSYLYFSELLEHTDFSFSEIFKHFPDYKENYSKVWSKVRQTNSIKNF